MQKTIRSAGELISDSETYHNACEQRTWLFACHTPTCSAFTAGHTPTEMADAPYRPSQRLRRR